MAFVTQGNPVIIAPPLYEAPEGYFVSFNYKWPTSNVLTPYPSVAVDFSNRIYTNKFKYVSGAVIDNTQGVADVVISVSGSTQNFYVSAGEYFILPLSGTSYPTVTLQSQGSALGVGNVSVVLTTWILGLKHDQNYAVPGAQNPLNIDTTLTVPSQGQLISLGNYKEWWGVYNNGANPLNYRFYVNVNNQAALPSLNFVTVSNSFVLAAGATLWSTQFTKMPYGDLAIVALSGSSTVVIMGQ
jgi:hypothetical protein